MTNFEKWKNKSTLNDFANIMGGDCSYCPADNYCTKLTNIGINKGCEITFREWGDMMTGEKDAKL